MGGLCSKCVSSGKTSQEKSCDECALYVLKALDSCEVKDPTDNDYSACLQLEGIGEELTFDLSEVTLDSSQSHQQDQVDKKDNGGFTVVDAKQNKATWARSRRHELSYTPANDVYSTITTHKIDVSNTAKRTVVALSDLHLGGPWAKGMDGKLEAFMESLITTASEKIACVVLVGDIFEMWLEKFSEVPPSSDSRVSAWRKSSSVLIKAIHKLVDECGVQVFYIRGNHDREITEADVMQIFDDKITFVPCTLVLQLKTSEETEHRIRFCHGHEYDLFNSYILRKQNHLIPDKPIGYYVSRAVATAEQPYSEHVAVDLLIKLVLTLLRAIPEHLEDNVIDAFLRHELERKLLERLFEGALEIRELGSMEKAVIQISEDKWIRLNTLLNYPVMRLIASQVGKQDTFHMIKAATGDYRKFVQRMEEDVVIMGHTHKAEIRKYQNYHGNQVIYTNTGCWTAHGKETSSVFIDPPSQGGDGEVSIRSIRNQ